MLITETQAIAQANESLKKVSGENWTKANMNQNECENFIWGYLYDNGLQYLAPIFYDGGVILCHQECVN